MTGHISDHQPGCDLVAKPNTGPLRGWVCTCRRETTPPRHEQLRERLALLGFTREEVDNSPSIEFWVGGARESVLLPLDESKGDYAGLCRRVERCLEPYERVFALGETSGMRSAKELLAAERDKVAILVRDGLPEYGQADQRFLDGVSHAWSVIFHALDHSYQPDQSTVDAL